MKQEGKMQKYDWMQSAWFKRCTFILIDGISVILGYLGALLFRFGGNVPAVYMQAFWQSVFFIACIYIVVNAMFHLYSSLWQHAGVNEIVSIALACVVATCLVYLYATIFENILPRSVYIAAGCILMLLFGFTRMAYRIFRRFLRGAHAPVSTKRNALIVGAGETGSIIAKQMHERDDLTLRVMGYVDDDVAKRNSYMNGYRVLGGISDIPRLVERYQVQEIIYAIPSATPLERKRILEICTATGCKVKMIPGLDAMLEGVDIRRIRDINVEDLLAREPVHLNIDAISQYLTDSTVLVTGGGGSIGSELCRQIVKFRPKRLVVFDIYENNAYELSIAIKSEYGRDFPIDVVIGSVRDMQRVDEVFAQYKPDIVFHAAAHKHVPLMEVSPAEAVKNNVNGTFNVAKAADLVGVKRFVLISTDKAVNPTNIMGATKYLCELIMQYMNQTAKTTKYVAVRFGNVLGSNGSVIPLFKRQIEHGGPVTVTHKDITRYFMTIPEAAQLVIQAGSMIGQGEIFVLDMGAPVKIDELARTFIRLSGLEPDVDIRIVYTGLRPGEKMYEELWQNQEDIDRSDFPGIFVGRSHMLSAQEIKEKIDYLRRCVEQDPTHVHMYMEKVVPTYRKTD